MMNTGPVVRDVAQQPVERREEIVALISQQAAVVDGMVLQRLAARERIAETRATVADMAGIVRKLGRGDVVPMELPASLSGLTSVEKTARGADTSRSKKGRAYRVT
jgi:hypothetical protein